MKIIKTPFKPPFIKGGMGDLLKITLTSLIAAFACTGIIYAATTVGTNISTTGTLSVTGISTLTGNTSIVGTLSVSGDSTFTAASSTGIVKFANINSDTGAISFGDENLTTTGNINFATASSTGIVKFATINSDTGAISFGDDNLTTTGTLNVTGLITLGNASTTLLSISNTGYIGGANGLILADGSITDASGAISFGNENLTTNGDLTIGNACTAITPNGEDLCIDGDVGIDGDVAMLSGGTITINSALMLQEDVTNASVAMAGGGGTLPITGCTYNLAIGYNASDACTSADYSVVIGAEAGTGITSGAGNTAIGGYALNAETTGGG